MPMPAPEVPTMSEGAIMMAADARSRMMLVCMSRRLSRSVYSRGGTRFIS